MLQSKSLSNQLVELKMAFDAAIMHGDSFADVKKIYTQIKEIEKLIVEREATLFKTERQQK